MLGTEALAPGIDLLLPQGADSTFTFVYQDGSGVGIDLTGWSAHAQVRRFATPAAAALADLRDGAGITLGSDGTVTVTFGHELMAEPAWEPIATALWDLYLTDTGGTRVRFVDGTVTIAHGVTRG